MSKRMVDVSTIVRTFPVAGSAVNGAEDVYIFDQYLRDTYFSKGWELFSYAPFGMSPEGREVLVVLVRYEYGGEANVKVNSSETGEPAVA